MNTFRRFDYRNEKQRSDAMTKARKACAELRAWERGCHRDPKTFSWKHIEDAKGCAYVVIYSAKITRERAS